MAAAHRAEVEETPSRPLRLVVADNDVAVLELLLLDLRLEGHHVVASAATGEEALQACREHQPDVLVVDLRLGPGIDGLEVARRLERSGPRVVLHTNYVNAGVLNAAQDVGVTVVEKGGLGALRRAILG